MTLWGRFTLFASATVSCKINI